MSVWSGSVDFLSGWAVWSLANNLGHRWWHVEMRNGNQVAYAHGEREHRLYDPPASPIGRSRKILASYSSVFLWHLFGMASMFDILTDLRGGPQIGVFRSFNAGLEWLLRALPPGDILP